ncbi:MAG: hypothetical protein KDD60_03955 [Bdellovibrionales bacterium]|nr:hypothetical protein [Bdellovibrionales bacterium]
MREAVVPDYRLSKSSKSNKILISLALSAIALGIFSSLALTLVQSGIAPDEVALYYAGDPPDQAQENSLGSLSLGAEPRPLAELAEVTHLHLVGGSLLLFLLCHLISLCAIRGRNKSLLYIVSFTSYMLTFASPWLIVFAHRKFAVLFSLSIIVFILSLLITLFVIFREMWGSSRKRSATS